MSSGDEVGDPLLIGSWFQGPTGRGQGGWTAAKLAERVGDSIMVWFRAAIPLETTLPVVETADGWQCRHEDSIVLDARPWAPDVGETDPVSIEEAVAARSRFPFAADDHPVPHCFSCGIQPDGMGVHAGPLHDAADLTADDAVRYATDWAPPAWAVGDHGDVDPAVIWAALDCTAAFFVNCHPRMRFGVTAGLAVEILRPLVAGETLALVGWRGDGGTDWDGRKRLAASTAFDADGATVARARSLWVALDQ